MNTNDVEVQNDLMALARGGDAEAFERLVEPYRRELLAHCYRILGSFEDAEDMLQETLVRVWKHLDTFEGRATLRAWLYKIATHVCLDTLDARKRRGLPREMYARGDPTRPLPEAQTEKVWVEPFPDEWIDQQPDSYPEARYEIRESITLAFVAALQKLPGRQRAALLLRDVLGWNTQEAAMTLEMSTSAMNSALQRARTTIKHAERKRNLAGGDLEEPLSSLLVRYVAAWERADSAALVAVLREDIALTMPPLPVWFYGRSDIQVFLDQILFKSFEPFRVRLVPVRANGGPAFAVYQMDREGVFRAAALQILTLETGQISGIDDYLTFDGRLFKAFNLPLMV